MKDVMQNMVRTTRMVDADGQAYTCRLPVRRAAGHQDAHSSPPDPSASGVLSGDPASSALLQAGPEEEDVEGVPAATGGGHKTPEQLLEKLSSLCFFRQEGLWTYEVRAWGKHRAL